MEPFPAIADPVRRQILEMLRARPLTAGAIASAFDVSRPAVSRHLRVLREARLVVDESRGRERLYRVNPEPLAVVDTWLAPFRLSSDSTLDALETEVYRTRRERRVRDRSTQQEKLA
jgi:DNA-binding transcriptional ArsR family regulator